jgi:hypothetical protein
MEKKRKIKVIKTIRKTDFLKTSRKRTLLKLKKKDEGVLGLIANTRLYSYEYESIHKLNAFSSKIKNCDFFDSFAQKLNSLNDFEFNVARKFVFNSIKKNEHSHLILSALIISENEQTKKIINYIHSNLLDRKVKNLSSMKLNLIDHVLNSKPNDLISDSLQLFLSVKKNQIHLNNQFVFFYE